MGLKIILAAQPVLGAKDVVDIAVDLAGVELARWTFHERIERLVAAFRVGCVRGWNDELASSLGLKNGKRHWIDLAGGDACRTPAHATSIRSVHEVCEIGRITIGIGQPLERRNAAECSTERVADPLALIRGEEEQFVLDDGSADGSTKHIAMQRRG